MDVFVSGAACRAVFVQGTEVFYINLDRPMEKVPMGDERLIGSAVFRALADSPDIQRLSVATEQEAMLALLDMCNKDSALRLLEIALDSEDDPHLALDAIAELNHLICCDGVHKFLANYAFAVPYPMIRATTGLPERAEKFSRAWSLISDIGDAQPAIVKVREAWSKAVVGHFDSLAQQAAAEKTVIEAGGFKSICELLLGKTRLDAVIFDLHLATNRVRGYRELIGAWINALGLDPASGRIRVTYDLEAVARDSEQFDEPTAESSALSGEAERVKFQRVMEQRSAIVRRLERDDVLNARRFTHELIENQIGAGDSEFAAKTLCSLAQDAKHLGYSSLRLEWTLWATEVYPDDPWPFAQAGDAFISLFRYDEARQYFDLAQKKGDFHYSRMGHARIAMATGRPEESLAECNGLLQAYPDHKDTVVVLMCMGDTHRSIGNLQEALAIYEKAAMQFPAMDEPVCAKASVLGQLGQLDEALALYGHVREAFGQPIRALVGEGEVHRAAGQFDLALASYEKAIARFPGEAMPAIGRAQVFREAGRLERALEAFAAAKLRFENDPRAYSGFAQTLRDLKQLPEALAAFDAAVSKFPYEAYLRNGRASVTKRMGRLEDALRAYDENCQAFPYNIPALMGRVQLLKELERLDLAADAVRDISVRHPDSKYVRNARASILALQGRYDEALALLNAHGILRTMEDWNGHHVKCMIWLRKGELDEALAELRFGLANTPFQRAKNSYQSSLAMAELRRGQYEAARELAATGAGAPAQLAILQVEAAQGHKNAAIASLRLLEQDPHENVVVLAREVASLYNLRLDPPKFDHIWVANRNAEIVIALAAA